MSVMRHHHGPDWLLDPARPLNGLTFSARGTAKSHAEQAQTARWSTHPQRHTSVTHDDMLAQLTFGVLTKPLPTTDLNDDRHVARKEPVERSRNRRVSHLADDPDGTILSDRVRRLHALRNRVSRMEPLLSMNISARLTDSLAVLGLISPAARN